MNRAQRRFLHATVRPGARGRSHTRPISWAQDDRTWFERRPDRSHRVRGRFPGEEFGPSDDPTLNMVVVKQMTAGIRFRSPFEIPPSRCAERLLEVSKQEDGAALLFDWVRRGVSPLRCDEIEAILDRQGFPGGRAH
jgi:hypothetical protein